MDGGEAIFVGVVEVDGGSCLAMRGRDVDVGATLTQHRRLGLRVSIWTAKKADHETDRTVEETWRISCWVSLMHGVGNNFQGMF